MDRQLTLVCTSTAVLSSPSSTEVCPCCPSLFSMLGAIRESNRRLDGRTRAGGYKGTLKKRVAWELPAAEKVWVSTELVEVGGKQRRSTQEDSVVP